MLILKIIIANGANTFRKITSKIHNVRALSFIPNIKFRRVNEKFYINKDKVPKDYLLIYRAPMENYLMASKNITSITAVIVSIIFGYNYITNLGIMNLPEGSVMNGLLIDQSDLLIFTCGFIFITIVLRIVMSKYPLRIYRNNDKYIAVFEGQIPFRNYKLNFIRGEVSETRYTYTINPWADSMYKLKNKKSLLLIDYFKSPAELTAMMTSSTKKV